MADFAFKPGRVMRTPSKEEESQKMQALTDSVKGYKKSKWHYDRAGVVTKSGAMAKKRPGSFEGGIVNDYRSQLKAHGIDFEDYNKPGASDWQNKQGSYRPRGYKPDSTSEK